MEVPKVLWTASVIAIIATLAIYFFRRDDHMKLEAAIQAGKEDCLFRGKRLLVLLNPFGGGGRAFKRWQTVVRPSLQQLGIMYDLVQTTRAGHAFDLAATVDTTKYAGMLALSGDTTLHEVINGLYERCGKSLETLRNLEFTLVAVPSGTSNGFSVSLGSASAVESMINLAKCSKPPTPVDLYQICSNTPDGKQATRLDMHCFSTCIGADHEEIVERTFRGNPLRTLIAPLVVISQCKSYPCKVYLKPSPVTIAERERRGLRDPSGLRSSDDPLHDDEWRMIDEQIVFCTAINTEMGGKDMILAPGARIDDGALTLLIVRRGVSRWRLVQLLTAFETGGHARMAEMEIYKVEQVQFRPLSNPLQGTISISGTLMPACDTNLEIIPRILKVVSK